MSVGTKSERMRAAALSGKEKQSLEAFLAEFSRPKQTDRRKFRIRHRDGSWFKKWIGTGWETVKRVATWTTEEKEAASLTLDDWEKNAYVDLVCGFGASISLEAAR